MANVYKIVQEELHWHDDWHLSNVPGLPLLIFWVPYCLRDWNILEIKWKSHRSEENQGNWVYHSDQVNNVMTKGHTMIQLCAIPLPCLWFIFWHICTHVYKDVTSTFFSHKITNLNTFLPILIPRHQCPAHHPLTRLWDQLVGILVSTSFSPMGVLFKGRGSK